MITYKDTLGSENSHVGLSVTIKGRTVQVGSGEFGAGRNLYRLPEDTTFTLDVMPFRCALSVYLVEEKATGNVSVLVDDAPHGESYLWSSKDPFTNLVLLMLADIRPNTDDLDAVEVLVFRQLKDSL